MAEFAEILRRSEHARDGSLGDVLEVARAAVSSHRLGPAGAQDQDTQELLQLVRRARTLWQ